MKRTFKLAGSGLLVWIGLLVPTLIVVTVIVNMMHPEAMDFKNGKLSSISTPKLEQYEEAKSEFIQMGILCSLVISQVAVVSSALESLKNN